MTPDLRSALAELTTANVNQLVLSFVASKVMVPEKVPVIENATTSASSVRIDAVAFNAPSDVAVGFFVSTIWKLGY